MPEPARPPLVRPELGPALTELLRRRYGVRPRTTLLAAAAILAALAALVVLATRPPETQITHRTTPVFTMRYLADDLRRAPAVGEEIVRLEGRRRGVSVTVTVQRFALPPYAGDLATGLLPSYAEGYIRQLRGRFTGFRLLDESRARFYGAPGYQLGFRTGTDHRKAIWRHVILLPDPEQLERPVRPDDGVLVTVRQAKDGGRPLTPRDQAFVASGRSAFRSFSFGLERP